MVSGNSAEESITMSITMAMHAMRRGLPRLIAVANFMLTYCKYCLVDGFHGSLDRSRRSRDRSKLWRHRVYIATPTEVRKRKAVHLIEMLFRDAKSHFFPRKVKAVLPHYSLIISFPNAPSLIEWKLLARWRAPSLVEKIKNWNSNWTSSFGNLAFLFWNLVRFSP